MATIKTTSKAPSVNTFKCKDTTNSLADFKNYLVKQAEEHAKSLSDSKTEQAAMSKVMENCIDQNLNQYKELNTLNEILQKFDNCLYFHSKGWVTEKCKLSEERFNLEYFINKEDTTIIITDDKKQALKKLYMLFVDMNKYLLKTFDLPEGYCIFTIIQGLASMNTSLAIGNNASGLFTQGKAVEFSCNIPSVPTNKDIYYILQGSKQDIFTSEFGYIYYRQDTDSLIITLPLSNRRFINTFIEIDDSDNTTFLFNNKPLI
jgi:hypothetical protein